MSALIDLRSYPVVNVLKQLLQDKTTKQNIIFATDNYMSYGEGYGERDQITVDKLLGFDACEIQPRVAKSLEAQKLRTKVKAEVMTPGWIVCKMNDYADEDWFGRPNVFHTLDGQSWTPTEGKIEFPEKKKWQAYVDSRRIEITCGEAPYIVSRYDVTTGEVIPIERRIGLLDRKMRVVNENTETEEEWIKWTLRAFQSVYGYEFQGDNLLLARINLLNSYIDYIDARLHRQPTSRELLKFTNVIVWNFWQMDGLSGTIPFAIPEKEVDQTDQFTLDGFFVEEEKEPENIQPICVIRDWRETGAGGKAHKYTELKK